MQYTIDNTSLQPSKKDLAHINSRISLVLSRFTNIIENLVIAFKASEPNDQYKREVECTIHFNISNAQAISISDSSDNLAEAFNLTLNRTKRNIERQLKRAKSSRVGCALGSYPHID